MQEAVGEIVEVVQPLAQVGIGLAQHAGAIVGLHALDGGLGRETGEHRLAHAAQPALVVGEHAESLEHLAVLAVMGDVAMLDELVDGGAHGADRLLQALDLDLHVLGDDLLHDHARLVQHHMAEPDAVGEADAALVERAAHREAGAGRRQGLQLARGDHLGEHHGGRLQRLDLFLRIGAVGPVLDDEHAERVAAAQDRHAEEAVIDLLARLRLVREGRMRLRVGEGERLGGAGDQADEAVAGRQGREVDGFAVQAFGGVELKRAVAAHDVDGAHLRHHVGGDQHDDAVEALLGADRLRHDLAQAAQEHARAAVREGHGPGSILHRPTGGRCLQSLRAQSPWAIHMGQPAGSSLLGQASSRPYSECSVRTASSV